MLSFENYLIIIYNTYERKGFFIDIYNNKPITIPATPDVGKPSTANDTYVLQLNQFIFTISILG